MTLRATGPERCHPDFDRTDWVETGRETVKLGTVSAAAGTTGAATTLLPSAGTATDGPRVRMPSIVGSVCRAAAIEATQLALARIDRACDVTDVIASTVTKRDSNHSRRRRRSR